MLIPTERSGKRDACYSVLVFMTAVSVIGCGGEPSQREIENARAFEALLTAVSLKHAHEVERDAKQIEQRHDAGELSDKNYQELAAIIAKARTNDWAGAQQRAYEFRSQFGDQGSFFE